MSQTTNINWDKVGGLVPAVVQDATSGQVLMLGYMNDEALNKTLETGQVTFWSRSKNRLWTKGESSGNVLELDSIRVDCDEDTLLVTATPVGPTCHLGTPTCFDSNAPLVGNGTQPALVFLHQLEQVLAERKDADPDSSYTASLYARGTKRISQKVGEEGVEVALAATSGDKAELVCESADLLYHLIVLLQDQGLSLSDITAKLQERHK
ncbi:bifunctional phosphoribosyl-AMP cyclohydrolase/phosphoribosyl-ATP diphosphatase HisIE [Photobacterium atrarenae]|uniref:Histidine biosynthesis bifunctional protein HisIE n=1 Tax=Photobacterium atrarenae TaxID=865757 RepID=A0ABY5GHE1_9GAMM|nr:bifunctional phosphoribosyl-AMP cyclohydrolase/phosphoribosyl-ATP diphosphatase HisIE [Photobacterium atrarenae]UTV28544.1 bifunctional phosphoribosyl-AMP cyclohydrolase/phosphoribosyl-ATP diphosphatase HisIE [Photobacterium atrarenae]